MGSSGCELPSCLCRLLIPVGGRSVDCSLSEFLNIFVSCLWVLTKKQRLTISRYGDCSPPYLIIVTTATTDGGVLFFQAGALICTEMWNFGQFWLFCSKGQAIFTQLVKARGITWFWHLRASETFTRSSLALNMSRKLLLDPKHWWQDNSKTAIFHVILTFFLTFFIDCGHIYVSTASTV